MQSFYLLMVKILGKINPINAAELAKKYNIPVYTIGIGYREAPFINELGRLQYAYVTLDKKLLKEVADITGGKFFNATNSAELKQIYKEINRLLKPKQN